MQLEAAHLNLVFAWVGILLGFISGLVLGLKFHREDWLGGYGSHQRRLYRLAHISLFGLGAVNLLFYMTVRELAINTLSARLASWAFIFGAVSMPLCCVAMAHWSQAHLWFAIPVLSLVLGGFLTVQMVMWPAPAANNFPSPPVTALLLAHPVNLLADTNAGASNL